ncbi:2OG-Fe(II) oxygenase [Gallaecimonas kandeliae]|uniref:2OG-Fe(II) oxygenase n=1 Tax=Gallaecimonas kandeliae TaxID=3029055 RepID=UPI0026498DAE|nr:2OG-Fe(II) oxygenase [Gallaecimonas kandeliae]WKE65700.1 2OG-Fe(II) oxygenase [Gallaecimonas kandeliae]
MLDAPIPPHILNQILAQADAGDTKARQQAAMLLSCAPFVPADLPAAKRYLAGQPMPPAITLKVAYGTSDWDDDRLCQELLASQNPEMTLLAALVLDCRGQQDEARTLLKSLNPSQLPLLGYLLSHVEDDAETWLAKSPAQHPLVQRQRELLKTALPQQAETTSLPEGMLLLPGFISSMACAYLRWTAAPWLAPAQTLDPTTGQPLKHLVRTNGSMSFSSGLACPFVIWLERRIATAVDLPADRQESTGVLHYQPGQAFKPHFDAFDTSQAGAERLLADGGQRAKTVLIYLNEDFTGGETDFPRLDFRVRGRTGDLLAFDNVDADGQREALSLHQGLSTEAGTKWLLSKWIRQQATDHGRRLHGSV